MRTAIVASATSVSIPQAVATKSTPDITLAEVETVDVVEVADKKKVVAIKEAHPPKKTASSNTVEVSPHNEVVQSESKFSPECSGKSVISISDVSSRLLSPSDITGTVRNFAKRTM